MCPQSQSACSDDGSGRSNDGVPLLVHDHGTCSFSKLCVLFLDYIAGLSSASVQVNSNGRAFR